MSRIFLGNVSRDTTVEDVEEFFSAYPKPHEVILKDGFAFVELTDPADAADAVRDLHQKPIRGQAIAVELARTRAANGSGA
ncbi:hypothetical protein BC828DRAFT_390747 [Blastocladiella britannica]|nr:hypothetical protein BC828DRAFT_390747 [Blastocladiella britannica]